MITFINKEQYFFPVPKEAWEHCIGGYQVLDHYLKARKARYLVLDEIEHIQRVIQVLRFTHEQVQHIDTLWRP
jgi:hypothetical protein